LDDTPPEPSPIKQALQKAGIGEPKRSALAGLEHVTPEYVNAWEVNLKQVKGKRYTPGLLIYVLEKGDPAPPVNANGHHPNCECDDCKYIMYRTCWYCKKYPCVCPSSPEDEEEDNDYDEDTDT